VALAYIKSLSHGELKSLIKISKRLRAELDLSKILVEVDLAARSLLGADIIEIWMYENGRPNRIFTTDVDKLLDASEFRNFVEEAGRKLMVEGEPLYFEEIPFPKSAKDKGFPRSALFVPLYEREGITGHLNIYHLRKRRYSREEIELAQALGDQISIALMNSRILKNLEGKIPHPEQRPPRNGRGHSRGCNPGGRDKSLFRNPCRIPGRAPARADPRGGNIG